MFFCQLFLSRVHNVDLRKYAIICRYSVGPDCLARYLPPPNPNVFNKHLCPRCWHRKPLKIPIKAECGNTCLYSQHSGGRSRDFWVRGQPGLQSQFQDSQNCTEKPCLKKQKPKFPLRSPDAKWRKYCSLVSIFLLLSLFVLLCPIFSWPTLCLLLSFRIPGPQTC